MTVHLEQSLRGYYDKQEPITIETENLLLRPIQEKDKLLYQNLFSDAQTMLKYADTEKRISEIGEASWQKEQQEKIAKRVDIWVQRWKDQDPFGAFAIFNKKTKAFIGHIVVGHGDNPGEASLAYVIMREEWKKGYGTQAVGAIVNQYLPALIKVHLECRGKPLQVEGAPFSELTATTRKDNVYSVRILEKAGMTYVTQKEEYGALRAVYRKIYPKS